MVRFKVALFALFGPLVLQFPAEAGVVYFTEPFANNDAGWTLDSTWQIGSAASSSGNNFGNPDPAADHTATADNGIAGVEIGGNAPVTLPDPEHGYYYLTSPVVNTVGAPGLYLDFYRWLNSDYTPYMQNQVQVYDGANWQTIWGVGRISRRSGRCLDATDLRHLSLCQRRSSSAFRLPDRRSGSGFGQFVELG